MRIIQSLAFLVIFLWGSAGFTEQEAGAELPKMKRPRMNHNCVRINRIRGEYEFLDSSNLVVWAGRRHPYHIQLSASCQAAKNWVGQLSFRARGGLLCGGAGDYIVMRDAFGLGTRDAFGRAERDSFDDRCLVRRVRALGEEGLYELMIELNKTPPPPPIPPPEVEVLPSDAEANSAAEDE
jgi:hypothetical protein